MPEAQLVPPDYAKRKLASAFQGHDIIVPTRPVGGDSSEGYYRIALAHNGALSVMHAIQSRHHIPCAEGAPCMYKKGQIHIHPSIARHQGFLDDICNPQVVDLIAEVYASGGNRVPDIFGRTIAALDPEKAQQLGAAAGTTLPAGSIRCAQNTVDTTSQPGGGRSGRHQGLS